MKSTNWQEILKRVEEREKTVKTVREKLRDDFFASGEISSTDIFVEKAEIELSDRSTRMMLCAIASLIVSLSILIGAYCFISTNLTELKISPPKNTALTTQWLIAGIIRNATLLGFVLGGLYLSVSLFRAFLHEATILRNRVHSVRLGRLYIYLKYGSVDCQSSLDDMRDKISGVEIERIFGWNIETSTAFKDIDPTYVTKTIWSNIPDMISAFAGKKDK